MNKDNVFRSSDFFMKEGDVLHILIVEGIVGSNAVSWQLVKEDEETGVQPLPDAPVALPASDITIDSFVANWNFSSNSDGYYLDVAEDSGFANLVGGYSNLNVGDVNEYSITGLTPGTSYYYRVRGYNDTGAGANSNIISLDTISIDLLDKDGNVYTTIIVGDQEWLVENLKVKHYDDGTLIPEIQLAASWTAENGTPGHDGARCYYDNDEATYAAIHGAFYNHFAVENAHGLSYLERGGVQEAGWRIPSLADWQALSNELGGDAVSGGKLKTVGLTYWLDPNEGATDEVGFTGIASGYRRGVSATFFNFRRYVRFWASDSYTPLYAHYVTLFNEQPDLFYNTDNDYSGFSIRLVRDVVEPTPQYVTFTDGTTTWRKGVRGGDFVIDATLTSTGFAGTEDVDWTNIKIIVA